MSRKELSDCLGEIRFLASLHHPNIVQYIDSFTENTNLCLVLEMADGGDLASKIERHLTANSPFAEDVIWAYFLQIIEGLAHLHKLKILHRDLKSANIFLTREGKVKIGDLNVSTLVKAGLVRTQIGTPYYMSPEIWANKPYDDKSDIWSAGCILYELCSLRPPFRGRDLSDLSKRVLSGYYAPITGNYTKEIQSIISACLQLNPNKRPSAEELLNIPAVVRARERLKGVMEDTLREALMEGDSDSLLDTINIPVGGMRALKDALPAPQYHGSLRRGSNNTNATNNGPSNSLIRGQDKYSYNGNGAPLSAALMNRKNDYDNHSSIVSNNSPRRIKNPNEPLPLQYDAAKEQKKALAAMRAERSVVTGVEARSLIYQQPSPKDKQQQRNILNNVPVSGGIMPAHIISSNNNNNNLRSKKQQDEVATLLGGPAPIPVGISPVAAVRLEARRKVEEEAEARISALKAAAKGQLLPSPQELYGGVKPNNNSNKPESVPVSRQSAFPADIPNNNGFNKPNNPQPLQGSGSSRSIPPRNNKAQLSVVQQQPSAGISSSHPHKYSTKEEQPLSSIGPKSSSSSYAHAGVNNYSNSNVPSPVRGALPVHRGRKNIESLDSNMNNYPSNSSVVGTPGGGVGMGRFLAPISSSSPSNNNSNKPVVALPQAFSKDYQPLQIISHPDRVSPVRSKATNNNGKFGGPYMVDNGIPMRMNDV